MILVNRGEAYIYADVTYRIGDSVVANDTSPYQGLLGIITEIRCGKDKVTDNETPDIYCAFEPPARDIYAGKASEIDGQVYEVVRLAEKYGVELPVYEKIASELKIRYKVD